MGKTDVGLLQQLEFNILTYLMNSKNPQQKLLGEAVTKAKGEGLEVTYHGAFTQSTARAAEKNLQVPFVIAQTKRQKNDRKKGVLEGIGYDAAGVSKISGKIDSERVSFVKKYDGSTNPIGYEGVLIADADPLALDKNLYKGKWGFESPKKVKGMASEGKFELLELDNEMRKNVIESIKRGADVKILCSTGFGEFLNPIYLELFKPHIQLYE
jgi:hypothetical protein